MCFRLRTGSGSIDNLLGGGIPSGQLIELWGEASTGKSTLCHSLAISAQLPVELGGGAGSAIYIDTQNRFMSNRILSMSSRFGGVLENPLDKILVARAHNVNRQIGLLFEAKTKHLPFGRFPILIVDSFMWLYRTEYDCSKELWERQNHLGHFLRICKETAVQNQMAVVITNQVYSNFDGNQEDELVTPMGGKLMEKYVDTRLHLRRDPSNQSNRICRIHYSNSLPAGREARFKISEHGIEDVE